MINLDGNVLVELNGHSFRYSNTATPELLLLLSNLLTNQPLSDNRPAYIALWNASKEDILQQHNKCTMLTQFIDLARGSSYNYQEQKAEALFKTTITPQFRNGYDGTIKEDLTLTIVSQDKKKILAAVSVRKALYETLTSGNIVNIEWTVSFSNKDEIDNITGGN